MRLLVSGMVAILENGRHNRPRHNLAWHYSYIYLFCYNVHVCHVSCFYHKMHDFSLICWTKPTAAQSLRRAVVALGDIIT